MLAATPASLLVSAQPTTPSGAGTSFSPGAIGESCGQAAPPGRACGAAPARSRPTTLTAVLLARPAAPPRDTGARARSRCRAGAAGRASESAVQVVALDLSRYRAAGSARSTAAAPPAGVRGSAAGRRGARRRRLGDQRCRPRPAPASPSARPVDQPVALADPARRSAWAALPRLASACGTSTPSRRDGRPLSKPAARTAAANASHRRRCRSGSSRRRACRARACPARP